MGNNRKMTMGVIVGKKPFAAAEPFTSKADLDALRLSRLNVPVLAQAPPDTPGKRVTEVHAAIACASEL